MSIELYFLVNLAADLMILGASARALGCFSMRRVLFAAALCAAYGVLGMARSRPWASVPMQLALLTGVSLITYGRFEARSCRVAALLLCGATISGGVSLLLPGPSAGPARGLACAGAGALFTSLTLAARHPVRDCWQICVSLRVNGRRVRFPALIDTGNRLREPISGLPVLIAEAGLLKGAMPLSGWRRLRFGAIGGDGQIDCFRPDGIWIGHGRRWRRAPDAWIAVSFRPLPGDARALAPCEFASYPVDHRWNLRCQKGD